MEQYRQAKRTVIISMILCIFFWIFFVGFLNYDAYKTGRLYKLNGTITEVEGDTITFVDNNGEEWQFRGVKDWCEGDTIEVIVNSNNTPEIQDDEIVELSR